MGTPWIGSRDHKEVLCRFFIETHQPYEPEQLEWPDLDGASRHRLASLPIWEEAVRTEAQPVQDVGENAAHRYFASCLSSLSAVRELAASPVSSRQFSM